MYAPSSMPQACPGPKITCQSLDAVAFGNSQLALVACAGTAGDRAR